MTDRAILDFIGAQKTFVRKAGLEFLDRNGSKVIYVNSVYNLLRVAGVLKYTSRHRTSVFFRGQHDHYGSMHPKLLRGIASSGDRNAVIRERLGLFRMCHEKAVSFRKSPRRFRGAIGSALFQHYDIPTPWLDLTDNMYVALYFACTSASDRMIHDGAELGMIYCFKVRTDTEIRNRMQLPGEDWSHCWCDLRRITNPLSLTPHSQHGAFLSRPEAALLSGDIDFMDMVAAIIAFPISTFSSMIDVQQFGKLLFPRKYDHTFGWLNRKRRDDPEFDALLNRLATCCE